MKKTKLELKNDIIILLGTLQETKIDGSEWEMNLEGRGRLACVTWDESPHNGDISGVKCHEPSLKELEGAYRNLRTRYIEKWRRSVERLEEARALASIGIED